MEFCGYGSGEDAAGKLPSAVDNRRKNPKKFGQFLNGSSLTASFASLVTRSFS
jgi:hypothetical protein